MKTYDFKQVACVAGAQVLSGFAEGDDSIQVETATEAFSLSIGADGEGTRSKSNNKSGKITVKLQKTSDSNDILNAFFQADKISNSGVFPFMIKDNNGRELHVAEQCYVEKAPDAAFGEKSGERVWVLATDNLDSTFGGN